MCNPRFAEIKRLAGVAAMTLEDTWVPAERFQPGKTAWKIVDQNTGHHYHEHAEQIRAWRTSRGI